MSTSWTPQGVACSTLLRPFVANLGQGNARVLDAMLAQGRRLSYTYSRTTRHEANAELADDWRPRRPRTGASASHLGRVGGSRDGTRTLARHAVATGHPERHGVISMMPGYHGATLQTLAMNGDVAAPGLWGSLAVMSVKIPAPLTFRASSPRRKRRRQLQGSGGQRSRHRDPSRFWHL